MNKAFEKIIERLEELRQEQIEELCKHKDFTSEMQSMRGHNILQDAKKIVQEVAEEYNGGWIACSERLPEESGEYLTWVEYDGDRFRAIDEIDCDGIIKKWNCSTYYKIIAWQPLPEPYKERD